LSRNKIYQNIFLIVINITLIYISNYSIFANINNNNIFTFWEPRDKIPGMLTLCIKTWKKFFTNYKIIILDYEKTREYLGETLFSSIICKNMTLPIQSDAIRVAILNKYGGIWMDTDTIVCNNKFIKQFNEFELAMIGEEKYKFQYIGFIFAHKNSSLLSVWQKEIINKVKQYKYILANLKNTSNWQNSWKKVHSLFYLSYDIMNPLLKNETGKKYFRLDSSKINCFPERTLSKNNRLKYNQLYKEYFFQKGDPNVLIKNTKGLILLHNSWTPLKYKHMSEKEFLKQDILISKLFKKLLC
jgi:L-rhamnose mutarotase